MRTGRPSNTVCTRGHNMNETRKFHPNGDSYCSACKLIRYNEDRKKDPERFKQYERNSKLNTSYGLTSEVFDLLLKHQGNGCAICGTNDWGPRRPHIDHDHTTNKLRGILCHSCNTALGLFKDNAEILQKAIEYLNRGKD